jgi:hypothetical protein
MMDRHRLHTRSCSARFLLLLALALPSSAAAQAQTTNDAPSAPGQINGQVTNDAGAGIAGAAIARSQDGAGPVSNAVSDIDGRFSLSQVAPGRFTLTVSAAGFASVTVSGTLAPGERLDMAAVRLTLALGDIDVDVRQTQVEVAEQQLNEQIQQRLFGVVPNFRVSYRADAVPLTGKQKFKLTWKAIGDPFTFAATGVVSGIQHARDDFSGFGRGPEGYAKRYLAAYGTAFTATMISNALLPTIFKQDPRYFYKGTGSRASRAAYAVSRAVMRKTDSGRWQPDYSRILGSLAAGALSNLYYADEDRRPTRVTLLNAGIRVGGAAGGNLLQEFLYKKLTRRGRGK